MWVPRWRWARERETCTRTLRLRRKERTSALFINGWEARPRRIWISIFFILAVDWSLQRLWAAAAERERQL